MSWKVFYTVLLEGSFGASLPKINLSKDGVLADINWEPTMCRKKGGNARSRPL